MSINSNNNELVRSLRSLQAKVGGIKQDMRNYHEQKERELSAVSDQISLILNSLVADSAAPLPQINGASAGIKRGKSASLGDEGRKENVKNKIQKMENLDFQETDGFADVYTDGACPNNGKPNARAGVGVWWGHGNNMNISQPIQGDRHTNNSAEIQAATIAINQAVGAGVKKLRVNTDSEFLINCVTQWMAGWKRNGWITKSKQPVKNKDDLVSLDDAMNSGRIEVKWKHIKGHAGHHGNTEADKLAVLGANM